MINKIKAKDADRIITPDDWACAEDTGSQMTGLELAYVASIRPR